MAYTYNPNYLEGRDKENYGSRPDMQKKKVSETPISSNKLGMVVSAYALSYAKGKGKRNVVWGRHCTKSQDPIKKNN
jgi:hypothetical protein